MLLVQPVAGQTVDYKYATDETEFTYEITASSGLFAELWAVDDEVTIEYETSFEGKTETGNATFYLNDAEVVFADSLEGLAALLIYVIAFAIHVVPVDGGDSNAFDDFAAVADSGVSVDGDEGKMTGNNMTLVFDYETGEINSYTYDDGTDKLSYEAKRGLLSNNFALIFIAIFALPIVRRFRKN